LGQSWIGHLGCGVGAQPADIQRFAFRVGEDKRAGQPLDALQRDRPLAAELLAPPLPPCQYLCMAGFGLGQTPLGPGGLMFQFVIDAADLVVDPLEHLGQGQLDVLGYAVDLRQALRADLVDERRKRVFVEPGGRFREGRDGWQVLRRQRGAQVAEHVRPAEGRRTVTRQLHGEQAFVDHLSKTVDDASAVEVEA
jgi:hypothetical protein